MPGKKREHVGTFGDQTVGDRPTPPSNWEWTIDGVLRPRGALTGAHVGIFNWPCGTGEKVIYDGDAKSGVFVRVVDEGDCTLTVTVTSWGLQSGVWKEIQTPNIVDPPDKKGGSNSSPLIKRGNAVKVTIRCDACPGGRCKGYWEIWLF